MNDKEGNFWPVGRLAPCNWLTLPHDFGNDTSSSDCSSNFCCSFEPICVLSVKGSRCGLTSAVSCVIFVLVYLDLDLT